MTIIQFYILLSRVLLHLEHLFRLQGLKDKIWYFIFFIITILYLPVLMIYGVSEASIFKNYFFNVIC